MHPEIVDVLRRRFPGFEPCAHPNGTERPDVLAWLMTQRVGDRERGCGSAGPRLAGRMRPARRPAKEEVPT